jgi:hypothetical protein
MEVRAPILGSGAGGGFLNCGLIGQRRIPRRTRINASALLSDSFVFPLLQGCLFLIFIYAWSRERRWFKRSVSLSGKVFRNPETWENFPLAWGILSLIFVEVNNMTESMKGYKTVITLLDIAALLYLCFFTSWFRNKSIWLISRSKQKQEEFHA